MHNFGESEPESKSNNNNDHSTVEDSSSNSKTESIKTTTTSVVPPCNCTRFCFEDVVTLKTTRTDLSETSHDKHHHHKHHPEMIVGVVQKVYGSLDDDSDEEDESDDDDKLPELEKGQVVVEWDSGTKEVVAENTLSLIDRSLLHGDIICSISDPFKQSGTVIDVTMYCDISFMNTIEQSLTGASCRDNAVKMKNVNSKWLKPLHYYKTGSYAVYHDWLTKIESCEFNVAILFNDGSKCILKRPNPEKLLDTDIEDVSQAFYPCQLINFNTKQRKRILSQAHWLNGAKYNSEKHKIGQVINITPVHVSVSFIYSIYMMVEPPDEDINLKDLKIFKYFTYSNWSVNDVVLLSENNEVHNFVEIDDFESQSMDIREKVVVIDNTHTMVDVEWQDATIEKDIPSIMLQPLDHVGEYDFYPHDFVVNKSDENEEKAIQHKVGCVQSVNTRERICKVKWITDEFGIPLDNPITEDLSIFDLLDSTDYCYRLGDVVIQEMASSESKDWAGEIISMNDEELTVQWISGTVSKCAYNSVLTVEKIEADFRDDESNPYNIDPEKIEGSDKAAEFERELALANRIAQRISDNGDVQLVLPPHLRARLNLNDDSDEEEDDSDDEENESWETVSGDANDHEDDEQSWETLSDEDQQQQQDEETSKSTEDDDDEDLYERGVQDYIHRLIQLSNDMRDREGKITYKSSSSEEYIRTNEEEKIREARVDYSSPPLIQPLAASEKEPISLPSEEAIVSFSTASASSSSNTTHTLEFEQFEVIPVQEGSDILSDHHFRNYQFSHNANKKFIQTVQKEWRLLRTLPKNIFVKTYENRIDLMRAMIIGASGTPYYDGVFVFDIYLPHNYPSVPPVVKFFSYNEKLNPNLYENGNICLSLLNTWEAKHDTEAWNPKTSNILQLLLSIQGLVLVPEPYFNEANYDRHLQTIEGTNNSIIYNENALLLSVRHMMKNLRHPPKHFETIIRAHFREQGPKIIERLVRYLAEDERANNSTSSDSNGVSSIGNLSSDVSFSAQSTTLSCDSNGLMRQPSQGFLRVLSRVIEKFKTLYAETFQDQHSNN
ncbi:hypothetical protein FDP41_011957 [Naegleria fowleri]|uniref:UBC core domain-containing protein n=1 Tax=Naegleria fowleri TaxID=5763 RepID=A0A6A5C302_NAEFO|nr:uncharacterized protein FDP41_011957 [Naegleria fowleri]KAF0982096.1 hypothetical protein FDP41_011957 [Naegleria fowleri]